MNLTEVLNWRYATKRMIGKAVPQETLDRILEATRLAPSSYGLQPYSILVVSDPALREKIASVADHQPQITEGSHLLIFAAWTPVHEGHVDELIQLTAKERGLDPIKLTSYSDAIKSALARYTTVEERLHWAAKQAYLALGVTLTAAAAERVDATPMEGFDPAGLDELLKLERRGLRSIALMALGYRDTKTDRLAGMKKVRWPREKLFIKLDQALNDQ